tara:strand:+ start:455 stop:1171 length:717 start_codon:yes stop_codon:yes gene_type:complete
VVNGKKVIAVIPARSGSKGLPGKNTKDLCGKPLIAWSIKAALKSKHIDEVCVSSDSEEIIKIARDFGINPNFKRPAELAQDDSTMIDVLFHALEEYKKINKNFDIIVCLEPTSPTRESQDIDESLELLVNNNNAWSVASVTEAEDLSLFASLESGFLSWHGGPPNNIRRQEKQKLYYLEGTVLLSWVDKLVEHRGFYHGKTLGMVVPRWKSTDIDDLVDWYQAESIIKNLQEIKNEEK